MKHRTLNIGEIIKKGDEVFNGRNWSNVSISIGHHVNLENMFRRPIEKRKPEQKPEKAYTTELRGILKVYTDSVYLENAIRRIRRLNRKYFK